MIKLLNENAPFPFFEDGVFSIRQRAFFDSYGASAKFFSTWVQTDEENGTTAVITSLSGDITLSLCDRADFEEINEFLGVIGFSSIFLNNSYASFFPFEQIETGSIMELKKTLPECDFSPCEPDYKAVFDLLFENEKEVSFSDWFTDISLRIRRDTAVPDVFVIDCETVACAFCQAKTKTGALIGFVKTDKKYRKKGIGTLLVTRLCSFLQQNGLKIYLCREKNKNKEFYSRIGFEDCGEWASVKK